MVKGFFGVIVALATASIFASAQQWEGGDKPTNPIWRSGNVGIGLDGEPSEKFEVSGNTKLSYLIIAPQDGSSEGGEIKFLGAGSYQPWCADVLDNRFRLHSDGIERFAVTGDGALTIRGTNNPYINLAADQGAYPWWNVQNNQGILKFAVGETPTDVKMTLKTDGALTIRGSNNPYINLAADQGAYPWWNVQNNQGILKFAVGETPTDVKMVVTPSGNVGIGTDNPGAKLDVNGDIIAQNLSGSNVLSLKGSGDGTGAAEIRMWDATDNKLWVIHRRDNAHAESNVLLFSFTPDGLNWTEALRLSPNGNVGIGTSTLNHKLNVNGTIRAKEVIVESGWSDYVFAGDYRLRPLSEVEEYIRANKRLPDVPSAADVQANGVSMGEAQATLLRKVEELTLYMIELKKENQELRKAINTIGK